MPYTATLIFELKDGKLTYVDHLPGQAKGVAVNSVGDIEMTVAFGTEVHIEFKSRNGLQFTEFELKTAAYGDYEIDTKKVEGKHDLLSPKGSFILVNKNLKESRDNYGLVAIDPSGVAYELDPAVRNLGDPRLPTYPQGWWQAFLAGVVVGAVVTATLLYFYLRSQA